MNRLLLRQLRRFGLDREKMPADAGVWRAFLERVSDSYDDADQSRYLLERSLRISSKEMAELNEAVRRASEAEVARSNQRYINLLMHSVMPTWQADFSLVGDELDRMRSEGLESLATLLLDHPAELDRLAGMVTIVAQNDPASGFLPSVPLPYRLSVESSLYTNLQPAIRAQFLAMWERSGHARSEISGRRPDGREFHGILYSSVARIDGALDLTQVTVMLSDVTALKRAEADMERLVRSKDEFLAAVSHEIRTPLTSVLGSALLLREEWRQLDRDDTRELVDFIAKESAELSDLVEDLLVAARADMDGIAIAPRILDIAPEVQRVVEGIRDHEDAEIDVSEVHGAVVADPLRFKQILRNLITNAVRYGGPDVRVQAEQLGDSVFVAVCDNGAGIAVERREAIFDLYERDESQPSPTTSVGVGLTVSRQLARLMGGDLTYDDAGGWSRFRLELPSAPSTRPHAATAHDG